eukprot:TRINITY_DN70340_c0_g1_i1.p1 TRINITY_DN70340_c0_g1~~TRINITY_DN70340_c0_g1_i1.p1  ORF type:complete len:302 (-),score=21.19 TRINITY_DN70340_c0_g1_i1:51-905(-)
MAGSATRGDALVPTSQEFARIYDPSEEWHWEQKYKFFSDRQMKHTYRVFTRAKHDPFNKNPSWGKRVIARIAQAYAQKGSTAMDNLLNDSSKNGNLTRPEVTQLLCGVIPELSDNEATAIFDAIDVNHRGVVSVARLREIFKQDRSAASVDTRGASSRGRNPVHRIHRFPPARPDGWDHLSTPSSSRKFDDVCSQRRDEIIGRLEGKRASSARAAVKEHSSRYKYFGGGGDSARMERLAWTRGSKTSVGRDSPLPDPGPDLRPGWLCDRTGHAALQALATPRQD